MSAEVTFSTAEAIKEAQRGGIALAKANQSENKYRGRKPSYSRSQFNAVVAMLEQEAGISAITDATNLSRQAVYRIRDERADAEASLVSWGL
jgi:putative DNA-invertase from lambdoid prophage Rac